MKYRKLPVVIDAWPVSELLHAAKYNWPDLPIKVAESYNMGKMVFLDKYISVLTLEGVHHADMECMLIRGVEGEFYGCDKEVK